MNALRPLALRVTVVALSGHALLACSAAPDNAASSSSSTELGAAPALPSPGATAQPPGPATAAGAAPSPYFCPAGYAYDTTHRLCASATDALGPFPAAMVASCKKSGGGAPCDGARWNRDLAIGLRGNGRCPNGSALDATLDACVEGGDAYGPFLQPQVARCTQAGGGNACASMRWAVGFLGAPSRAPLDVPYLNQYDAAAINPGGSCGNTSAAMVLDFWGKATTPDAIHGAFAGGPGCGSYQPWQCTDGLVTIYRAHGLVGHAKNGASRADIRRMIDEGRPVIIHTNMTSSGHIVVIVGYDDAKGEWAVNDPAGHWCGDGYTSCGGRGANGKGMRYSYASFDAAVIGSDGDVYISAADTKEFAL